MSSRTVFVTGTDTGLGKTLVSSWLCLHWQADYWKPIQSGLEDETDSQAVARLSGQITHPERHRLQAPLSPHKSAALEGTHIQLADFVAPTAQSGRLVIEGAGGCLVPVNNQHTLLDLMVHLQAPVLLVARSTLGTINHTCLSLQALRRRGVQVLGVILSGPSNPDNRAAIEQFGQVQVLAEIPHLDEPIHRAALQSIPMPQALRDVLNNAVPPSNANTDDWIARDQRSCWHPFTQAKTALPPVVMDRGQAEWLWDTQGRRYFDAVSSWWVNIHGHAHPHIAHAVAQQAQQLPHVMFAGITHPPAVQLAEQLLAHVPPHLTKVFYSDNGSTALEVAFKMAFQYWHNLGQPRRGLIALQGGYHGDTFGAMAAGQSSGFYDPFKPWLFEVDTIPTGTCECTEAQSLQALDALLASKPKHHAAIVLEPLVQGAAGMRMMRPAHVAELVRRCKQAGLLVIFDEVMTGFGRTGSLFACQQLPPEGQPDLLCLSKGLTGGFIPMGATLATNQVEQAFYSNQVSKALLHGHSYTANPLACAAALASLQVFSQPHTLQNIQNIEACHLAWLPKLSTHPSLDNPRVCGSIAAFEFKLPQATGNAYGGSASQWIREAFLKRGIITRPLGNTQYFIPPLCTAVDTLHWAYEVLFEVLDEWQQQNQPTAQTALPSNTELF